MLSGADLAARYELESMKQDISKSHYTVEELNSLRIRSKLIEYDKGTVLIGSSRVSKRGCIGFGARKVQTDAGYTEYNSAAL